MMGIVPLFIGTALWGGLFWVFIRVVRPESQSLEIKNTRRRFLVFSRAILIFFYSGYLIAIQEIFGNNDPENEIVLRYITLTFYIFDLISLALYLKSTDVAMLVHHILSILLIAGLMHFNTVPFFFKYELFNVEMSAIFQSSKDNLRSLDRGKTKIAMILEFGFILIFFFTKIIFRTVLLYVNLFFVEAHYLFKVISVFMQIVFYYWGWKVYLSVRDKRKEGYFNWKDFERYSWIEIDKKSN
jgi:hypothetical protein